MSGEWSPITSRRRRSLCARHPVPRNPSNHITKRGMTMLRGKPTRLIVLPSGLAFARAAGLAAQQQVAAITGRGKDASASEPVPGAQVMVVGTSLGAQTNSSGTYIVRGVAPGNLTVCVLAIGFTE